MPILLIFKIFFRIIYNSPPTPSLIKRAEAIYKTIIKLRKFIAKKKVIEALNTKNSSDITVILPYSLIIGSEVRVYRKKNRWTGLFKIFLITNNKIIINSINVCHYACLLGLLHRKEDC